MFLCFLLKITWKLYFLYHSLFYHVPGAIYPFSSTKDKVKVKIHSVVSDSLHPMDCSLPGFSIHGIFHARVPEWVAVSFSRGSSQPRNRSWVSCIAGRFFTNWGTREAHRRLIPLLPLPWECRSWWYAKYKCFTTTPWSENRHPHLTEETRRHGRFRMCPRQPT